MGLVPSAAPAGLGWGTCLLLELTLQVCSMAQGSLVRGFGSCYLTSLWVLGVGARSGFPCPFGGFQLSVTRVFLPPVVNFLHSWRGCARSLQSLTVATPVGVRLGGLCRPPGPVRLTSSMRVLHSLAYGAKLSHRGGSDTIPTKGYLSLVLKPKYSNVYPNFYLIGGLAWVDPPRT